MTSEHEHFSAEGNGRPTAEGRFVDVSAIRSVEFVPGLEFRPVLGEDTMVNFVTFAPHTEAPRHVHKEEQIVIVLEGQFDFEIDGETRVMRTGDVAVIPSFVPHGAWTTESRCVEMDVFNPPRMTLLEHARSERERAIAALEATEGAGTTAVPPAQESNGGG
ncbi:MAG: cupin domain-containing protein [Acidimicrobiales bacterium]